MCELVQAMLCRGLEVDAFFSQLAFLLLHPQGCVGASDLRVISPAERLVWSSGRNAEGSGLAGSG